MSTFKLSDPYGSAPTMAPFAQSVSCGTPWHNMPVTREYTLGQLLDQTIARCGENDAVVYADRDFIYRVSSATVDLEVSDFTALPDYNRLISVLDGDLDMFIVAWLKRR